MKESITWVGLDAHKKVHEVAVLVGEEETPERYSVNNDERTIRRFVKKVVKRSEGEVRVCYEAGVCGFALQRLMASCGVECVVIAPSLVPVKPGERIKTDPRDALKLAEMYRAGLLTEIEPPTVEQESVREVCRCREAAKKDLGRAHHRLLKLLLRWGVYYKVGKHWTKGHMEWLKNVKLENPLGLHGS